MNGDNMDSSETPRQSSLDNDFVVFAKLCKNVDDSCVCKCIL